MQGPGPRMGCGPYSKRDGQPMVGTSVGATDGVKVWLVLLEDCCGERATVNAEVHLLLFILYYKSYHILYYNIIYL